MKRLDLEKHFPKQSDCKLCFSFLFRNKQKKKGGKNKKFLLICREKRSLLEMLSLLKQWTACAIVKGTLAAVNGKGFHLPE